MVLILGVWAEWVIAHSPEPEVERRLTLNNALRLIGVTHDLPAHLFESFKSYLSTYGTEYGWVWTKKELYAIWAEFSALNRAEFRKWEQFQRLEMEKEKAKTEREEGALRAGEPYRVFDPKNKIAEL